VTDAALELARSEPPLPDGSVARPSSHVASTIATDRSGPHPGAPQRRTDLLALRIALCGCIILLHVLSIFSAEPIYHVKSALVSPAASVVAELLRVTSVPLFFVIAGWSAVASLRERTSGAFLRERARRLLVPLVAGTVVFGSIIKYIERTQGRDIGLHGLQLTPPMTRGFLFDFFPHNLFRIKEISWSHLWFLAYLLLISLLLLPLLKRLARSVPRMAAPAAPVVYLPALALAGVLAAFNGYWPYLPNLYTDWTNFTYFALCFAAGAAMAAWPGFETRLQGETPGMLVLLIVGALGVSLCGESTAGRLFVGVTAWGGVGTALGVASRLKLPPTPVFAYLGEASMPVFIMHEVPVLMIGLLVLKIPLPAGLQAALIFLSATAVTLVAYHRLVRPRPWLRRLMGMDAGRTAREGG
jgi:surface polysaccharide O-acyltransferase-like enzyme